MLKTEFRAAIVGFEMPPTGRDCLATGQIYHYLPPLLPQIHQAVFQCDQAEIMDFTDKPDFLRVLLQVTDAPADALIAATVRDIYRLRKGDRAWLVTVGRNLSLLLKDDYDRLRYILSQISF